ncbi:MAG: tetratricopeptide repeat-containing glycosyltransferase family protein [Rhodospirillaceae bacterium]|nr:tetratricopeptide repeat-containing glycosyltransferase family protein [Rhodospirillaceae bacterium]
MSDASHPPAATDAGLLAQLQRAHGLYKQNQLAQARDLCHAVLAVKPRSFDALHLLGQIAFRAAEHEAAAAAFGRALDIKPGNATVQNNRGLALMALGRWGEALACFDAALALKPDIAGAHVNQGHAHGKLHRPAAALASYDAALALTPQDAQTWHARAGVLYRLGRIEDAVHSYDRAIALDSRLADAWSNRGLALLDLGRRAQAEESFAAALAVDPDHADGHWNLSLCALQRGDFKTGWAHHEWRWKARGLNLAPSAFAQPQWQGESLSGKTILLHADQGYGDALQFVRYAAVLARQGARVYLRVQKPLLDLLAGCEGVTQVFTRDAALPAFDVHCPLGSLPSLFQSDADTIPAAGGYLRSAPEKRTAWKSVLGPAGRPRIGLVWRGSAAHKNDHNRSIPLADLLAGLPEGFAYISLQKDIADADRMLAQTRPDIRVLDSQLADFSDTAAVCDLLDVVISVDTSVAHLAGALGRPVWLLLPFNPDWRWQLERADSPWYASARLYRQNRAGGLARGLRALTCGPGEHPARPNGRPNGRLNGRMPMSRGDGRGTPEGFTHGPSAPC